MSKLPKHLNPSGVSITIGQAHKWKTTFCPEDFSTSVEWQEFATLLREDSNFREEVYFDNAYDSSVPEEMMAEEGKVEARD